jgi:hypothetical protein
MGRVPQDWRRRIPMPVRNALVKRLGHPERPFDPAAHPRKVNLGAGYDRREGYLNVDLQAFHDPDLVGDARSLPELPSGFYEEVVAQDVLEHLERADGPVALREWRRLLAPGGRLFVRVPDLQSLLRWLGESDDADRHRELMHWMFGTQAYAGDFHLSGYSDVLLCDELRRAGFVGGEFERRDGWLWEGTAFAGGAPAPRPAMLCWGRGFHTLEGAGQTSWRWAEPEAELLLHSDTELTVELHFALERAPVGVRGAGVDTELDEGTHELRLTLAPGANRVHFSGPEAQVVPGDARTLSFRLGGAVLMSLTPVES